MSKKGLVAKVYEVKTLPNTARQLVEAIRDQKDLSMDEALEMADYLDERYNMSDYVPTQPLITKDAEPFSTNHVGGFVEITADFSNGFLSELMAGEEWYRRFIQTLGEPQTFVGYGYDSVGYDEDDVIEAAKKASNL